MVFYFQTSTDRMAIQLNRVGPPPVPELDPYLFPRFEAGMLIRDIDMNLLRQTFFTFQSATDRQNIIEMLTTSAIPEEMHRRLSIEAERHDLRLSTLVVLILRAFPLFNEDWTYRAADDQFIWRKIILEN